VFFIGGPGVALLHGPVQSSFKDLIQFTNIHLHRSTGSHTDWNAVEQGLTELLLDWFDFSFSQISSDQTNSAVYIKPNTT
jgi:hypothetical protein